MKQTVFTKDVVLVLVATFFYLCATMIVTPLIVGYADALGASGTMMGAIGGTLGLCALLCRPFVGNLSDRISKYALSCIGGGLTALSCIGYMLSKTAALLFVSRLLNGVGYACCSICLSTWMSNMLPREKIGSGMGVYGMVNAFAMAVAPAAGIKLGAVLGYRISFVVSLGCALAVVLTVQFIRDKGRPASREKQTVIRKERFRLFEKNAIPSAAIIMTFAIPYFATQAFLVSYVNARALSLAISLYFPIYAACLLVLRMSLKSLFDRLPFHYFLIGGSCCALLALALLGGMKNNIAMGLAALFMAGGYGVMCSVCQSTAILTVGDESRRGLANSTYYFGVDLGITLGPLIGGVLYGSVDLRLFYPLLALAVPLGLAIYLLFRKQFARVRQQGK